MLAPDLVQLSVGDASETDLATIARTYCPKSLLRDYFLLAQRSWLRCLVLQRHEEIIGFTLLVFRRPDFWPHAGDTRRLPEVVSLGVQESHRGRGYGSAFMRAIEDETAKAGYAQLHLAVDPINNPRAYAFYRRLNYQELQTVPYYVLWKFKDSQGNAYQGENWLLHMTKYLPPLAVGVPDADLRRYR